MLGIFMSAWDQLVWDHFAQSRIRFDTRNTDTVRIARTARIDHPKMQSIRHVVIFAFDHKKTRSRTASASLMQVGEDICHPSKEEYDALSMQ